MTTSNEDLYRIWRDAKSALDAAKKWELITRDRLIATQGEPVHGSTQKMELNGISGVRVRYPLLYNVKGTDFPPHLNSYFTLKATLKVGDYKKASPTVVEELSAYLEIKPGQAAIVEGDSDAS